MESEVTRSIEEQLSAFLDGELPDEELALLSRRLEREEAYRATLARYAAIGGVLRNDPLMKKSVQFRQGVMEAIATEASEQPVTAPPKAMAGARQALVAAGVVGVALAVFMGSNGLEQAGDQPVQVTATADAQPAAAATAVAPVAPVRVVSAAQPAAAVSGVRAGREAQVNRERMTRYLISHGEYARSFQGAMADPRIFVQQASFQQAGFEE